MNNFHPQSSFDDLFNCTYGCENATQCEFNNYIEPNQYPHQQQQQHQFQTPQQQSFPIDDFTQCINNFDDGVVPSNLCENGSHQQQYLIQNNFSGVNNNFYGANETQNVSNTQTFNGNNDNYYQIEQSYTPCRGPRPWNFAECFGFYGDAPCQYANNAVDMEDIL